MKITNKQPTYSRIFLLN